MARTTLYNQLIALTNDSFGLNSKLFIDDLIDSQLHIDPKDINSEQLAKIHCWLEALISLMVSNKKLVGSYLSKVKTLEVK